jgi:hypothetical protein
MLGGWIVGCQGSTMNNCLFFLLSAFEDQRKFVQLKKKRNKEGVQGNLQGNSQRLVK